MWVAHTATAVMLVTSLTSALEGFALVQRQPLNLVLALFFVFLNLMVDIAQAAIDPRIKRG